MTALQLFHTWLLPLEMPFPSSLLVSVVISLHSTLVLRLPARLSWLHTLHRLPFAEGGVDQ